MLLLFLLHFGILAFLLIHQIASRCFATSALMGTPRSRTATSHAPSTGTGRPVPRLGEAVLLRHPHDSHALAVQAFGDKLRQRAAQAVQLIAYDRRQALGGYDVAERTPRVARADGAAVDGLLLHWQQVLQQIGYLDPAAPKKLLPRLRRLLQRAELTEEEVHILRGIARAAAAGSAPRR